MERGAVLLLFFTALFFVFRAPPVSYAPRASGVHTIQALPVSSDCCLIPPNRGLYR